MFRSADNFMISGLDFERLLFDEAAEAFKEAYSRRLMGLDSLHSGFQDVTCISVEVFIIQTSRTRSLEAKGKHKLKLVCEVLVLLLVFDEIDR